MMLLRNLVFLLLLFISSVNLHGQKAKKLFRSDSVLELRITLPLKNVISDTEERNSYASKLSYTLPDGTVFVHNIKMKVRGKTRALKQICTFPPLELNFNKIDTKNSIFKGQKKLKLVTHCKNENAYEEYIQKEYVVYKMYEKISPYSYSVRLCHVTYIDENNPNQKNEHYAFLIESINDVAKRNEMSVFKDSIRNQEVLNKDNLDKLMLFEFMIGNMDWSVPKKHNMKLIVGEKGSLPLAVPYDFDYSGMVDTPYAVPPEESNISDVKTRVFRGFCRHNGYQETVDYYNTLKEDLYKVVTNASFLTDRSKNNMTKYLDSFYKNINDPKYVDKKINKACRVDHKHAFEYE
jgi:hypothetical protein